MVEPRNRSPYGRLLDKSSIVFALAWLIAFGLQAIATYAARDRFMYEELAESVRNPFWLDHRAIYDGVSSNVGWYGLVLVFYKVFGFSLAMCRWMRLGLQAISLYCLFSLLRRAIPGPSYMLVGFAIALSPTALYFNTYQASYGSDLQLAPIALACALGIDPSKPVLSTALHACLGVLAALACMSYPAFLFYLPFGAALLAWINKWPWGSSVENGQATSRRASTLLPFLAAPVAALLTIGIGALMVQDPAMLFYDPHTRAGLFRGGGGPIHWQLRPIAGAIRRTLYDLFVGGRSYYFSLSAVEFGGWLGAATCALTVGMGVWILVKYPRSNRWLAFVMFMMVFGLLVPNLATAVSGLRRCTIFLFGFYLLLTFLVKAAGEHALPGRWVPLLPIAASMGLVVHHALAFPQVVADLHQEGSPARAAWWLRTAASPDLSLQQWVAKAEKREPIVCPAEDAAQGHDCRYSELFAAVAGYQRWTLGHDTDVRIVDPKTEQPLQLSIALWQNYYFKH